jgi:hypothetical protein
MMMILKCLEQETACGTQEWTAWMSDNRQRMDAWPNWTDRVRDLRTDGEIRVKRSLRRKNT